MEKKEQIENAITPAPLNTVGNSASSPSSERVKKCVRDSQSYEIAPT